MTVAKLLIFVLTLAAFLAAVALGYVWVQDRQAASFAVPIGTVSTPAEILMRYASAPPIVCTAERHSFQTNGSITMYVANGKIHTRVVNASGLNVDTLIDESGAYEWAAQGGDASDVYHETPDGRSSLFAGLNDLGNATWDSCKPWWNPDDSIFKIPLAAIVHEAR